MISANALTKKFGNFTALHGLNCTIPSSCIYGLVGSNGAGKSTLLRLMSGIYKPDGGNVTLDDKTIFENPMLKSRIVFVPDELYFLPQCSMNRMATLYKAAYPTFDPARFAELTKDFSLDPKANIATFSKGMKRQAAIILALSGKTDYLFMDETFDGLDPIMRARVKRLLYNDVAERGLTAVISSHSLRELEDTCDQLALLHKGGLVLESDVGNLKTSLFKVQIAFREGYDRSMFADFDLLSFEKRGSVSNFIVRGDRAAVASALSAKNPLLMEILPLTLEEVFLYELEALGYKIEEGEEIK